MKKFITSVSLILFLAFLTSCELSQEEFEYRKSYNINIQEVERATVYGAGRFRENKYHTISIELSNPEYYNFAGWYLNDEFISSEVNYSFWVEKSMTFKPRIILKSDEESIDEHEVVVNSMLSGSRIEHDSYSFKKGQMAEIVAKRFTGYKFAGWYNNELIISSKVLVTKITKNKAYEARYSKGEDDYFVYVNQYYFIDNENYYFEVTGNGSYQNHEMVNIEVSKYDSSETYEFESLFNVYESSHESSNPNYSFEVNYRDYLFGIEYRTPAKDIKPVIYYDEEIAKISGITYFGYNEMTDFKISNLNDAYEFVGWKEIGKGFIDKLNFNIKERGTFQAIFRKKKEYKHIDYLENKNLDIKEKFDYYRYSYYLEANNKDNNIFIGWYLDDALLSLNNKLYPEEYINSKSPVEAKYRKAFFEVEISFGYNPNYGSVDGKRGFYLEQSVVKFEATALPGYKFDGWYDEYGELLTSANDYDFRITGNHFAYAKFSLE